MECEELENFVLQYILEETVKLMVSTHRKIHLPISSSQELQKKLQTAHLHLATHIYTALHHLFLDFARSIFEFTQNSLCHRTDRCMMFHLMENSSFDAL